MLSGSILRIASATISPMRKTKIICTIGPACDSEQKIKELINAGMNVARLNFSHENHQAHLKRIKVLQKVSKQLNAPLAILGDLQGPKIRVGVFKDGNTKLRTGQEFILTTQNVLGDNQRVSVSFKNLPNDLQAGNTILLDDGKLQLKVSHIKGRDVFTRVITGGTLSNRKGVNIPDVPLRIPCLTAKDMEDLKFMIKQKLDFIALSFVQSEKDVLTLRKYLGKSRSKIIAKLEKPLALKNLEAIMQVSDGVMVARGDLGVEISPENVPAHQKHIIDRANALGIPVITATQMLESMITSPFPTRAEASDVANAIFDGTDAVMLSGETASGQYPIEAVEMMNKIVLQAESHPAFMRHHDDISILEIRPNRSIANAIGHAAWLVSRKLNINTIAVFSSTGLSALMISKFRPRANIIALTPDEIAYRRMALYRGVRPVKMAEHKITEKMIAQLNALILKRNFAQKGDRIVIVSGSPVGVKGSTNLLKIHEVQ